LSFSIGDVLENVATVSPLPDLLAIFGPSASIGGAAIGVFVGKASTWRRSFEDITLGATVGRVLGCMLRFLAYLVFEAIGG
jgi:hypothetical protein